MLGRQDWNIPVGLLIVKIPITIGLIALDKLVLNLKQNRIEVHSSSGNVYFVNKNYCSCKGFSFRRTCRHLKQIEELGLMNKLTKHTVKSIRVSPKFIESRKKAIKIYLKKYNITFDNQLIDFLEKHLTVNTEPEKFKALALNGI